MMITHEPSILLRFSPTSLPKNLGLGEMTGGGSAQNKKARFGIIVEWKTSNSSSQYGLASLVESRKKLLLDETPSISTNEFRFYVDPVDL